MNPPHFSILFDNIKNNIWKIDILDYNIKCFRY